MSTAPLTCCTTSSPETGESCARLGITSSSRQAVLVRRSRRIPTWGVSLLAAAVIATSCGSDDPPDSAITSPEASTSAPANELDEESEPVNDPTTSSEPTTEPAQAKAPPTAAAEATPDSIDTDCRRLTDFDGNEAAQWFVVNDGVMGGRSNGAIEVTDSVMRFTGTSSPPGGGFTSVRFRLDGTELAGATLSNCASAPTSAPTASRWRTTHRSVDVRLTSCGPPDRSRPRKRRLDDRRTLVLGPPAVGVRSTRRCPAVQPRRSPRDRDHHRRWPRRRLRARGRLDRHLRAMRDERERNSHLSSQRTARLRSGRGSSPSARVNARAPRA